MKIKNPLLAAISKPEAALGLAACLSLALLALPLETFTHTLELDPRQHTAVLQDDSYSGGNSRVGWQDQKEHAWTCQLGSKFASPYCTLDLQVTDRSGRGLNLEGFSKMKLWATYKGNAKHLRIYLRNRSPAYYVPGDDLSTKYNFVEVSVKQLENGLELDMSNLVVASWWLVHRDIPLEHSKPEFSDVVAISVQTGSEASVGTHEVQLKKIVWQRPLISEVALYKAMVIAWSLLIFGVLLYRLAQQRRELNKNRNYQRELVSINQVLQLQNKEVEELARTDPLTGLLNRMGIRGALYDGLTRWKRNKTPFSLIIIDLDHFKKVNDTYGHDVGDSILLAAAKIFSENVRSTDCLARWGGEEFLLLCPDTTLNQAVAAAESLRKRLEASSLYTDIKVTASFGVAAMCEPDLDQLFKCADDALYKAKERGRNCVMTDIRLSA